MAYVPSWGNNFLSPIPLVKHGDLRQFVGARQLIRGTPRIKVGYATGGRLLTAIRVFLRTPVGQKVGKAFRVTTGPSRRSDSEQLMADIRLFLQRQRGPLAKRRGLAFPLAPGSKLDGLTQTKPAVITQELTKLFTERKRPLKKEGPELESFVNWFERRYSRRSPAKHMRRRA